MERFKGSQNNSVHKGVELKYGFLLVFGALWMGENRG